MFVRRGGQRTETLFDLFAENRQRALLVALLKTFLPALLKTFLKTFSPALLKTLFYGRSDNLMVENII